MKTLIMTLNAKFIHTALSLRLLYVGCKDYHDISFKEYTIKDDLNHVADDILSQNIDILACSCYIWNVDYFKVLFDLLKAKKKDLIIILGGPEVTYEPQHFIDNFNIDYCMSGEGELTLHQLLTQIENNEPIDVSGVSYKGHIATDVSCVDLSYVESLDSPYNLPQDLKDKKNRILYFETSRGCPFQCQYCLSSLEKGLRFFSHEYLEKQLDIVIHSGAKTVKLLDRSFNAKKEHAIFILDYIFKHYVPGQQFQFEINADVFQEEILQFIEKNAPKNLLRFEVGIQSTYEPTNLAVKRIQNFERLSEVVKRLIEMDKCDLHLDLIAGLPYESYERFKQSFDDVFSFRAKELQLGFLKMLRGTSLRNNADDWGYEYEPNSPYEMIKNDVMSPEDIKHIHIAEDILEKYWNSGRFSKTMNHIMDDEPSAFEFFHSFGCYYLENGYKTIGYQIYDLFTYINNYTNGKYFNDLLLDYLPLYKTRPKKWYVQTLDKQQRNQVIDYLVENYQLNRDDLHRYAIIEKINEQYVVAIYKNMKCELNIYD